MVLLSALKETVFFDAGTVKLPAVANDPVPAIVPAVVISPRVDVLAALLLAATPVTVNASE